MTADAQRRSAGAALSWLFAVLLAWGGAWHALSSAGHGDSEPVLHGLHTSPSGPRVAVRRLDHRPLSPALRVAALRLGMRWQERGVQVMVAGEPRVGAATSVPAPHDLLLGSLDSTAVGDPESVARALETWGLRTQTGAWLLPDGSTVSRGGSALCLTITQRSLADAVRRLRVAGLREALESGAQLVTLVLASESSAIPSATALRALSLDAPPVAPGIVMWSGGQRVFEAELDEAGNVTPRQRTFAKIPDALISKPTSAAPHVELTDACLRFSTAIRALGQDMESAVPIGIAELVGVEPFTRDGALQRCGWYDAIHHRLVLAADVAASADDAVEDFLETELLRTFGAPASPWLLRGLIYVFTGRAGGFSLIELESRGEPVSFGDVLSPHRRRSRLALAPVEARLARGVLALFNSDVGAAWGARLEEDEEILQRLRDQWQEGLVKAPVVPVSSEPRSWSGGHVIEIANPARGAGQLGSTELHRDLQRLASLGFEGVQLVVHVPVAPPGARERESVPAELQAFGLGVTVEGDGALLVSAAAARALGLSVVLKPRFVTSASGGLGSAQIHGTPERIRLYGERRALAMEGLAWLAEQAGAEAIVMFDPEELPRVVGDFRREQRELAEEARAKTRELSTRSSMPFRGERIAFCRSDIGMGAALESRGLTAGVEPGEEAPSIGRSVRVGLELVLYSDGVHRLHRRQVRSSRDVAGGELGLFRFQSLMPQPPAGKDPTWSVLSPLPAMPQTVFLGPWRIQPKRPSGAGSAASESAAHTNLRDFSDERLRGLAAHSL